MLCTLRLGAGHTDGGGSGGSGGSGPAAAVAAAAVPGAGAYSAPAGGAPGALPAIDTPGSAGVAVDGAAEPSSGPAAAAQGPAAGLPSPVPPAAATGCRRADPGAVLRPPPGCDHPTSRRLNYKTTRALTRVGGGSSGACVRTCCAMCASGVSRSRGGFAVCTFTSQCFFCEAWHIIRSVTSGCCLPCFRYLAPQIAVRFMVLRKGFEYVVEVGDSDPPRFPAGIMRHPCPCS